MWARRVGDRQMIRIGEQVRVALCGCMAIILSSPANPRCTVNSKRTNRSIAVNVPIEDPQVWQLISPYLDQALDLAPEQVAGWLDELAGTRPQIASMVRELLAQRDMLNRTGFLDEPIVETGLAWLMLGRLLQERDCVHSREALRRALDHLSRTVSSDHPALIQVRELLATQ
jgi:hypothetical protein